MKTLPAITLLICGLIIDACASPNTTANTNRIAGHVMEVRSGTTDVTIILCDQATGLPVSAQTYRPFTDALKFPPNLVTAKSGPDGFFVFTNVPPGSYRLVAQKWTGPFKGLFEVHGGVIQLFGTAENIQVPSKKAEEISLTPAGDGVLVLDLKVPNSGTLLVLSTTPMIADPILGFHALGTNFLTHTIGVNVMPYGRTTVVGVPRGKVHAWFFASDNSPGFSAETYDITDGFYRAPAIPFVAGWSNGRKDHPEHLQNLEEKLQESGLTARKILKIDENEPIAQQLRKFNTELERMVKLQNGEVVKTGDLVALIAYDLLKRSRKK